MSDQLSLNRRKPTRPVISLVPMIDVLLILLVFFMVTSTYLNLDMIPALAQTDQSAPAQSTAEDGSAEVMLIRIGGNGTPHYKGQPMTLEGLNGLLSDRVARTPAIQVIILPTGSARIQSLVSVMDAVTSAGVANMRVVRLEARS